MTSVASVRATASWPLWLVPVSVVYYAAARLSLTLQLPDTNASPVWPPSGIAFAAVLLIGYRVWPGIAIGEVFRNLITNAAKYNDKAEKWIEIGWRRGAPDESATAGDSPNANGQVWQFHVRDNGIGIREKHLDSVFRIFKRLHAKDQYGGGTGIGLSIAKKIVERHSGRIWVESTFGEGTTFFFTLQSQG